VTVDLVLSDTKSFINGRIADCSIAINDGKIIKIGKSTVMPPAETKANLGYLLVLPGLIDAHVHLRDQGKAYKEDFYTGTAAAAAGGFTTVLDMPNNDPVTMSAETLRNRMNIAQKRILVNVGFYSEFPEEPTEIKKIIAGGAVGFKLFMAEKIGGIDPDGNNALSKAFAELQKENVLVAAHAEDRRTVIDLEEQLKKAKRRDIEAFLTVHSELAEAKAIKHLLTIIEKVRTRLHICHISTKAGLTAVTDGKTRGLPITCETTPHHILLSTKDLKRIGPIAVTMPPVREKTHTAALWEGIRNGAIDLLASDHAPHTLQEKNNEDVWKVKVGIPGLETTLPLMLTRVSRKQLSLPDLVRLLAEKPAEIFGLTSKGKIEGGKDADLTVIDLTKKGKVDPSKFHSKAQFSPFEGWNVMGTAVKTFVGGKLVMDQGEIVGEAGSGQVLRRKQP
jgi:dihydroorotase